MIFSKNNLFEDSSSEKLVNSIIDIIKQPPTSNNKPLLQKVLIVLEEETIEKLIKDSKVFGGKKEAQDALKANITNAKDLDSKDILDFFEKLSRNEFLGKIETMLTKEGIVSFDDLKKIHPLIDKIFDTAINETRGLGTGQARAGAGEWLFSLLGAVKPRKGDLDVNGKQVEMKASTGYVTARGVGGNRFMKGSALAKFDLKISEMTAKEIVRFYTENGYEKTVEMFTVFVENMLTPNEKSNAELISSFSEKFKNKINVLDVENMLITHCFKVTFKHDELTSLVIVDKKNKRFITIDSPNSKYAKNPYVKFRGFAQVQ